MFLTENSNQAFFLGFGNMVHYYMHMQSIKLLSAISYKINILNADERKYISQMSAIDVWD